MSNKACLWDMGTRSRIRDCGQSPEVMEMEMEHGHEDQYVEAGDGDKTCPGHREDGNGTRPDLNRRTEPRGQGQGPAGL